MAACSPALVALGRPLRTPRSRPPLNVQPGATSLRAAIADTSDPAADLDLYLYDCHTGTCQLAAVAADADSKELIEILNPASGRWLVEVDAYGVPSGTTSYRYSDAVGDPDLGSVDVLDTAANRAASPAGWNVTADIVAHANVGTGRVLVGHVEVRTGDLVIGSNEVVIEELSPVRP